MSISQQTRHMLILSLSYFFIDFTINYICLISNKLFFSQITEFHIFPLSFHFTLLDVLHEHI